MVAKMIVVAWFGTGYIKNTMQYLIKVPSLYNFFSCSTKMDMTFITLINVKMPSIVDILTFISMTDTTSESLGTAHYLSVRGGGAKNRGTCRCFRNYFARPVRLHKIVSELAYQYTSHSGVRPSSVRQHFQTSSPPKPLGQ